MSNRKKLIRNLSVIILLFCFRAAMAHQPDLSSMMIYEQNGKTILLIKSSLTAFEQEIVYLYGKDSYKTPQEFQQLLIKHLQEKCVVKMNNESLKLVNPQVLLGHETTVFAELSHRPKTISAIYISNELFKDMPNNVCEVILTFKDLPQKQFVLGKDTKHEANLKIENGMWIVEENKDSFSEKFSYILMGLLALIGLIILILKKNSNQKFVSKSS